MKPPTRTEAETLNLFIQRATELHDTKYARNPEALRITVKFTVSGDDSGITLENEQDHDLLKSFVLSFRRFIAEESPVFIERIYSLLYRRLPDGELREVSVKSRRTYRSALENSKINLEFAPQSEWEKLDADPSYKMVTERVTPKRLINLWMNAVYFHDDLEKWKELDRLTRKAGGFVKFNFIDAMIVITNQIGVMQGVAKQALESHPEVFH